MRLRLIEQFEHRARSAPETLALRRVECPAAPQRVVTRGELAAWTRRTAATLAASIQPGGVVLICAPNQPEFTAAFLGTLAAGLKAFPVSPELAAAEWIAAAGRSDAAAVIGTRASLDAVAGSTPLGIPIDDVALLPGGDLPARPHDTAGLLLLSSGTTGRPKIVFRDARSLDAVSEAMAVAIGFTEADHVLACVPLCHSYGVEHGLLAPLWAGACPTLTCSPSMFCTKISWIASSPDQLSSSVTAGRLLRLG
jgi:acyl-CoA synthetase (AMP-forming)/AMP-acid ligase II